MTMTEGMLRDDAFRVSPTEIQVDVHLPWYRSLPLSCVEQVELTIDGTAYAGDTIRISLDGQDWSPAELAEQVDRQWFVQDAATLRVPVPDAITPGDSVDVGVRLVARIPYIIIGPDRALTQDVRVQRTLTAQRGA